MLFFNKGLIRHLIIWKTLHFKDLTQIWLSKVNGPVLLKERWRRFLMFFSTPKVAWHNRVPSKHLQLLNNMNVWMVLYCAKQLLGLKKIKNLLHLSLSKAGPFTLESHICVKSLKCKVFQIIRCLIKPLFKNSIQTIFQGGTS